MTRRLRGGGADNNSGGFLQSMGLGNLGNFFGSSEPAKDVQNSTSVSKVIDSAHSGIEEINKEIKKYIEEFNGLKTKMKETVDRGKQIRQELLKLKNERNILRNMKEVGSNNSEHLGPFDFDNSESSASYTGRLDLDETENNMNEPGLSNESTEKLAKLDLHETENNMNESGLSNESNEKLAKLDLHETDNNRNETGLSNESNENITREKTAFTHPEATEDVNSVSNKFVSASGTDASLAPSTSTIEPPANTNPASTQLSTVSSSTPIDQLSNTSPASAQLSPISPAEPASQFSSPSGSEFASPEGTEKKVGGTKRRRRYAYRRRSLRR